MKETILNYTQYNLWANFRIIELIKNTDTTFLDKEVKSSFSSIRKTIEHMFMAEEVWYRRLNGEPLKNMQHAEKDFELFIKQHAARSQSFIDFVSSKDEEFLKTNSTYKDLKGNEHINANWQMIMHCMNHSTSHRGQLITLLRTHGVTSIPATDMIVYFRTKA